MSSRVHGTPSPSPTPSTRPAAEPFKALLEEARRAARTPPGLTRKPLAAAPAPSKALTPKSAAEAFSTVTVAAGRGAGASTVMTSPHAATTQQLTTARAHHVATSEQLATTRLAHHETHEHQQATRVIDLIVKELVSEFEPKATSRLGNPVQPVTSPEVPFPVEARTGSAATAPAPSPNVGATADVRAAQAVALIERIETFVKSTRPALAMTLNNSLGARVELEKLGPGRIAVRLVGQNGPPAPETVSRIRDELRARGLEVGALSVA